MRGDYRQGGIRGDRRVDGIAAGPKYAQSRLAGEVVRTGHGTTLASNEAGGHERHFHTRRISGE